VRGELVGVATILEIPPHQIALQLGHTDGGRLVRELYGQPDAAIAREKIREAVRSVAPVAAFPAVADAAA
jgi:alkylhydroperoxidase/carboxymuconolactone decarboxylase family protein YurZ